MERSSSLYFGVGACILVLALTHETHAQYSGGTGEPNDPFQIATTTDLIMLGRLTFYYDKHFALTADIDLDPNLPGGKVFDNPIIAPLPDGVRTRGPGTPFFQGVLDGRGHAINNLTITGSQYLGLFGGLDSGATITNLSLRNSSICGTKGLIGGLVAWNEGCITGCSVTGTVSGGFSVGGLAGLNGGTIVNSKNAAVVQARSEVGGLAGQNSIYACISNCYSIGEISGDDQVGGLVGRDIGSVISCFWDIQTAGLAANTEGAGKTTPEMQTASTFLEAGWDFAGEAANGTTDIWWINEGKDYPRLWWERVLSDDFEDDQAGSLWMEYEPDPSRIRVEETNGRLEVYSSATADDIDAVYVSNGWRLDVSVDFALRVDFHYGKLAAGDSWVMVAFLPSVDVPVSQIITFEAGCMNEQPFYLYEAIDDAWRKEEQSDRVFDDGTLYASYDAAKDELYLSHTGYGQANAWRTITGLLAGRWQGDPVYVAVGGGSNKTVLNSGDAWLDNFIVNSGTLISPTPDDTAGLGD